MVVALKMQHAMHHHMGPVGDWLLALLLRLQRYHRRANNQISGQWHRYTRWRFKWEGQNIGGFVLAPVLVVQLPALVVIDNTDRHLGRILAQPGLFGPAVELRFIRHTCTVKGHLEVHSQLVHRLPELPSSKES